MKPKYITSRQIFVLVALTLSASAFAAGKHAGGHGHADEERRDAYQVLLIQKDGSSKVFNSYS
jgi:hypothetical protein